MKLLSFLLVFLAVSSFVPVVASAPDYVIFNDWIEPGNFITFNQYRLRLVEIIPAEKEANMSVTIELSEDQGQGNWKRLMYDILKYEETVTPHEDIKIQFNSVYASSNLKMAKISVWYKNEDQYVSKSWDDISDTVNQDELSLLRSSGTAGVIMFTGGTQQDETLILKNYGSKQVNNLVVTFSFSDDESYSDDFTCILPKTFIGAGESINIILSYIPSKIPPNQIRGRIRVGNSVMPSELPIYINPSSGQTNTGGTNPFGSNPFGGGTQQTQSFMYYKMTKASASSVTVDQGERLLYYTYTPVNFTFSGVGLKSSMGVDDQGKTIYYVEIPTTNKGTYSVGVGSQSFNVVVGDTAPQYEKGLYIEVSPEKDVYKAGDRITVKLKTTDGLLIEDTTIRVEIGDMSYNKKSGSIVVVPDLDESDVFTIEMSANYPNYGSADYSIDVDNKMSPIVALSILAGMIGVPIIIIGGIIFLLRSRKNAVSAGPNLDVLQNNIGKLG